MLCEEGPERWAAVRDRLARIAGSAVAQAEALRLRFWPQFRRYGEIVLDERLESVGVLVRGDGRAFTDNVQAVLEDLAFPPEARAHVEDLARWFEHRRVFFKVEWTRDAPSGPVYRRASVYFRRRPALRDVLARFAAGGVSRDVLAELEQAGDILEKRSVHFVAAALAPGRPIEHKLYFSQLAQRDPGHGPVATNVLGVLERAGISPSVRGRWASWFRSLPLPEPGRTLWVSLGFDERQVRPSVKVDIEGATLEECAALRSAGERSRTLTELRMTELRSLLTQVERPTLSYLGIRMDRGDAVRLKYYAALPDAAASPQ